MAEISYRDAINQALAQEMRRDETIVCFGEDVAQYEGSFKVTRGLLDEFGPDRVFDTPISEAAIIGVATGMAMDGLRPVPELMTVNFALLAMDQIVNHLALMRYMFAGQIKLPVTIRAPGGGGHQLGSQHSHSLEVFFCHKPGLIVLAPATPADAKALLIAAIRDENPVIFLEHEGLYNTQGEAPENAAPGAIGEAAVIRQGRDVTIVSFSAMVHVAAAAAEMLAAEGVAAELIDLRTLRPWDRDTVFESVAKTHRLVTVEESQPTCGLGAEIAAVVQAELFDDLDAPIARVSGKDVFLPYARQLEQYCIPDAEDVAAACRRVLGG